MRKGKLVKQSEEAKRQSINVPKGAIFIGYKQGDETVGKIEYMKRTGKRGTSLIAMCFLKEV